MKQNTNMIVRRFEEDEIKIIAIADLHLGSQEHMAAEWKQFCVNVLAEPNVYLLLAGDLCNNAVNKSEKWAQICDGIDISVTGHTHKAHTTKPMKLRVDQHHNKVVPRPYFVVGVGSWLSYGGYAMRKMLPPSAPALQIIKLSRIGGLIEVTTK